MYCRGGIPKEGNLKEGELFWIMDLGNTVHHVGESVCQEALLPLHLIEQEAEKILGRKRTEVILLGPSLQCPASSS